VAGTGPRIQLWGPAEEPKHVLTRPGERGFSALAFSADAKALYAQGAIGDISVWDTQTGKHLRTLKTERPCSNTLVVGRGGLVALGFGYSFRIYDSSTGRKLLRRQAEYGGVHAVALSPDGRFLATGGPEAAVNVWSADSGKQVLLFRGHLGAITRLAFTPDGKRLISTSRDGTALVWDVASLSRR
jgi:WD40 repeat protein